MDHARDIVVTLQKGFLANGLVLGQVLQEQLALYFGLACKWGAKINITSNLGCEAFVRENILDAAIALKTLWPGLPDDSGEVVADIGCGGGFTGLVWKLIRPAMTMTLIDSDRKKINFCKQVIRDLGISNCEAHQSRVEDFHATVLYQMVVTRATFAQPKLCEASCQALLAGRGQIVMFRATADSDAVSRDCQTLCYTILPENKKRYLLVMR